MSFDIAIWSKDLAVTDEEAEKLYKAICEGNLELIKSNISIDMLYNELTAIHPEKDKIPDSEEGNEDLSPWTERIKRSEGHLIICSVWAKSKYVFELLKSLTEKYNLALYDIQTVKLYMKEETEKEEKKEEKEEVVMENTIGVRFKYMEKEYKDAIKWYYLKSKTIKFDFLAGIVLILAGTFLLSVDKKSIMGIASLGGGIGFIAMLINGIMINPGKQFKKIDKLQQEYYLNFGENRIMFITDNKNSTISWKHYARYKENDQFFYLIYGKLLFTIVPKKGFKSKEDEQKFRNLVATKLKEEK